jgi:uncharacterized integral membrane protein
MRIKTMILIFITVLLTVILMQNTESVTFSLLFWNARMSKLVAMTGVAVIAFILGVMVGRPKRVRNISSDFPGDENYKDKPETLSDEDREYIN